MIGLFAALAGCNSGVSVRPADPSALLADQLETRLVSRHRSSATTDAIRSLGLDPKLRSDDEIVRALLAEADRDPVGFWRVAAAEVLLDNSIRLGGRDPSLDLACARAADRQIRHAIGERGGLLGSDTEFAADLYHRAVSRVVTAVGDRLTETGDPITIEGKGGTFTLVRSPANTMDRRLLDPGLFDQLIPADTLRISGMASRHRIDAYGSPIVAIRDQADAAPPRTDPFIPPEGVHLPATATIRFSGDQGTTAEFELWNPDSVSSIDRHGGTLRLSVDTTAPIASLFARTRLADEGRAGMLDTRSYIDRVGIYLHEPYDPEKIPLLMVHGLRSSPITWRDMLNGIRGDPVLREKYQVWMFLYPTGLPVFRSASLLRERLAEACAHLDPEGDDSWHGRMVVVGHSMGGLLTKMLVQDPGDALWASLSPEPFAELDAPPAVRDHFEEVFFYDSNPDIARVVFIATPHGGSDMADSWLGRMGDALVRLPDEFGAVDAWFDERRRDPESRRQADAYQVARGVPTSIDDLRPGSPHLRAIRELTIRDGVITHVIIGSGAGDSDGVVPVASARFEGAVSELILDAKHNAHEHPLAIREVRRILREHLDAADGTD